MKAANTKSVIYGVFQQGERLLSSRIAERANMSDTYVNKIIRAMCADGTLTRKRIGNQGQHGGSMEFEYYRSCDYVEREPEPAASVKRRKVDLVAAPYPHVLLHAAPADAQIGADLWKHARLCMGAR